MALVPAVDAGLTAPRLRASHWLRADVHGAVVAIHIDLGDRVRSGQVLLVLESMKMEVPLHAPFDGQVRNLMVNVGDAVRSGEALVEVAELPEAGEGAAVAHPGPLPAPAEDPGIPRAALLALHERLGLLADSARPQAVAARHAAGRRTARENVDHLLDSGSGSEYGALAVAAQRSRRSMDELQRHTPADGLITATGTVQGQPVAVMAYDYTVLAGTQGVFNHRKSDRLLDLAERHRWPVVLFAEGGGGRPGDVDWLGVAGLDCTTFRRFAALSGRVPLVGIVAGRCFAGNAALLGCCDLIIATEGSSIGMGGPAMIEGAGLGTVAADDVGPVDALARAGVIDLRVDDEAQAVEAARRWLSLASRSVLPARQPATPALNLRTVLAENRSALFDPRQVLASVVDADSLMEVGQDHGAGVITALGRIEGRALALIVNQPRHLSGALDGPACDKLGAFLQQADGFGWPVISLVDTPGFMVGPDSEKTGMVRRAGRLFVRAAAVRTPVLAVVLRRGYGLGAMAMTAGHFHAPLATCAWPAAEFGAMGLEGAVRLGFRKELEAAPADQRDALFDRLLAQAIAKGQALNMASFLEIDEVIDPADTRAWLIRHLRLLDQARPADDKTDP